jgi:nucleoside-diphosphate-sugar epimerase
VRILVAGAAGFIGSHLCDRLVAEGHQVLGVDNFITGSRTNLAHLDMTLLDQDVTETFDVDGPIDAVMNLASLASPKDYLEHPIETLEVGSAGSRNLLEIARRFDARYMVTSTSECYGDPLEHPQAETYWGNVNCVGPRSCYDESKRYAEAVAMAYHRVHGVRTNIARIFNTYGPRMHPDDGRVVSNFVVQALRGQDITVYGDGSQTRSFCYVDDLLKGMLALMEHPTLTGPVNIGNPGEFTIRQLAEQVIDLTGSKSKIVSLPLPSDDPRQRKPDITLARKELGWEPTVELRQGLTKTIAYFEELLKR